MKNRRQTPCPTDKVGFVGDPVAFVVADTLLQAKDAAEAVEVDIEPLPAVNRPGGGRAAPARRSLRTKRPTTSALDYHYGDSEQVRRPSPRPPTRTKLKIINSRVVVNAMERARGGRLRERPPSRCTSARRRVRHARQPRPGAQRRAQAGARAHRHVGGSFGMKAAVYAEYVCVLHAARTLGRRSSGPTSAPRVSCPTATPRTNRVTASLRSTPTACFLAVRLTMLRNMGGFLANVGPMPSTLNEVKNVQSAYRTPLIRGFDPRVLFTNTTHVSAYRGAGRPEGNYYMER